MKVDVIINVYGKPWQTICTLKSLSKHCSQYIDKIYFIKEKKQPYNDNINFIFDYFDNIVLFEPKNYNFTIHQVNYNDVNQRYNVRYQYGIENSDKKHVFITHNDVLYTGDIIGEMLEQIEDCIGIGEIGQCWNCPVNNAGLCHGSKFNEWNPKYEDIIKLSLPHVRTNLHMIDKLNPKPLPECRLNEWSCLINREIIMNESKPNGNSSLFGQYELDLGTKWFREMFLKGYKFKDYREKYIHGYWANDAGYPTQLNTIKYIESEKIAKKYYYDNFK